VTTPRSGFSELNRERCQMFVEELTKTAGAVGLESATEGREKVWLDVELVGVVTLSEIGTIWTINQQAKPLKTLASKLAVVGEFH